MKGARQFVYRYDAKRMCAPSVIRSLFNDNFYYDRAVVQGEFEQYVVYQAAPSDFSGQAAGSSSEVVIYHQGDNFVAEVHYFVLPDSIDAADPDLGASGKADPKELIHDDRVYYLAERPKRPPTRAKPSRRGW